jgi:hypothetical protein
MHWAVGAVGGAIFGRLPAVVRSRPWIEAAYGLGMWFRAPGSPSLPGLFWIAPPS